MVRFTYLRLIRIILHTLAFLLIAGTMISTMAQAATPEEPGITSPSNSSIHALNNYVVFTGSCYDEDDGFLSGASLVWTSSKNGPIGTGQTFSINTLVAGSHNITLVGTDSDGLSASSSITIYVGNTPPTATINLPSNNSSFYSGNPVTFAGTGTDADGDALSYSWTAYIGGVPTVMGSQSVISYDTLPVGTHVVVLSVDDGTDTTESSPITVTINNNPPTAAILSPSDNDSFYPGDTIFFNGQGSDPDGDALSYLWTFDEGGLADQTTASFSSTLPEGMHTVTFQVTDANGDSNVTTQSITLYVGNNSPTANIISPANGTSYDMGESILFQGTGIDTEDGDLSGASLVWTSSIEGGTIGTGTTFTVNDLQSGTHVITLTVSDTFTPAETTIDSVIITINNTFPTAVISSPSDGESFYPNTNITFSGVGNDPEDGILSGASLVWTSSLSGPLGTGTPLVLNTLAEGEHIITLAATDSSDSTTESTPITINVGNGVPTVSLTAPADGASYNQGETITFRGTASDTEDGDLTGASLAWTSNIDGAIGTGTILPLTSLSTGTHTITLTATDTQGESVAETIAITVVNSEPDITINSPPHNSIYETGSAVTLSATVVDEEDGILSGASLVWSSSLDGDLGTGTSVANVILSKGSHVLSLLATDSEGITAIESITVHIGNTPPTATITAPSDGTNYEEGEFITFTGTGVDEEDGTLTGASLVWTSNIAGDFATGNSPNPINNLSTGRHSVTLVATDSSGAITYSDSIEIRVGNNAPVATILSPADYSVYESGETIQFDGTGVDEEDGVLLGNALVWSSSREGVIGTGSSLTLDTLASGQHTIILTVTDLDGATATTSITIKAQNALPVVVLSSPLNNSSFDEGNDIIFQGTAEDFEDGTLTEGSLIWTSNLDGTLGTGTNLTLDTLSSGTHSVTLTATDNDGSQAEQSITLTVIPMTLSANTLTVAVGAEGNITINGGKSPYRVATRRAQIAMPMENNGEIAIFGVAAGSTLITVTDNKKNSEEIYVTVTASDTGDPSGSDLPDAYAGADQLLVMENTTVTLAGENLNDPSGTSTSFLWVQTNPLEPTVELSQTTVTLSDASSPTPSFIVPLADISGATLSFQVTATNSQGSDTDQVIITISDNGISQFGPGVIAFKSSTNQNLGVAMEENGEITMLSILEPGDVGSTNTPQSMTYGLITMDITADYAGATAVMRVYLPQAAPAAASWYKYLPQDDMWIDFDRDKISNGTGDGAVFSSNRTSVTLYITDDGPYDDSPVDGLIQDPSGLGLPPASSSKNDKDSGIGCFIQSVLP